VTRPIERWESVGASADGSTILMRPKRSWWEKFRIGWRWRHRRTPFIKSFIRLGFVLRTNNNARAVLWLGANALGFCVGAVILVLWFATVPDVFTTAEQRAYNSIRFGVSATNLEMSWFLSRFASSLWSAILSWQPWLWLAWVVSAILSAGYLMWALREEFAEAIDNAREMVSQRTTTDLPDQPSGQPSVHSPARVGGGILGNFLRNRMRFAAEDLSWEMIQEGIQRGWRALRGG